MFCFNFSDSVELIVCACSLGCIKGSASGQCVRAHRRV